MLQRRIRAALHDAVVGTWMSDVTREVELLVLCFPTTTGLMQGNFSYSYCVRLSLHGAISPRPPRSAPRFVRRLADVIAGVAVASSLRGLPPNSAELSLTFSYHV